MNVNDRTILITGCSSGIGLCAANTLRKRGYNVFAAARTLEDVDSLRSDGLQSIQLDLDSSESIANALESVLDRTGGKLFALFNNAAYAQPGAIEDLTRAAIREQFETNLFGAMELTNLVIPVMRRQGYGRIVQNSSVLGFAVLKYRGAYNASKFALEGLTDTMRLELKGSGIFVSIIEPGPIESKFGENAMKSFKKHIDQETSYFKDHYKKRRTNHNSVTLSRFRLGPEAVVEKLILALESDKPKIRYYVTAPTYLMSALKTILPDRWLDWLLDRIG